MTTRSLFIVFLAITLLSSCKLVIIASPGGSVSTISGSHSCPQGGVCEIGITDLLFNETFTAVADAGYQFSHWDGGFKRLCSQLQADCPVDSSVAAGNATLLAILASSESYYLEPVFQPIPGLGNADIAGVIRERQVVALVNADGLILGLASSFNRVPDVDVGSTGSNNAYSFAFSDIAPGEALRLFLLDNGRVDAIFGDSGGVHSNVFALEGGADIDLGVLYGHYFASGEGAAEFDLLSHAGVVPLAANRTLPIGLDRPPLQGLDVAQLVRAGADALSIGWTGGAKAYLARAVLQTQPGASNDADSARFLLALAALGFAGSDLVSDGYSDDLNRLGDVLDILGVADDSTRSVGYPLDLPESLDQSLLSAEQLSDYAEARTRFELGQASRWMRQVSASYQADWTEPRSGVTRDTDYGDAVYLSGLLELLIAKSVLADAYVGVADVNRIAQDQGDDDETNNPTVESVLDNEPELLALEDTSRLTAARGRLLSSIQFLLAALDTIQAEADPQDDDLIRIDILDLAGDDHARSVAFLQNLRTSILSGETLIEPGADGDTTEDIILDLQYFFDVGLDIRGDNLLPEFLDNRLDPAQPCLPDPTFNGVVISPDLDNALYKGVVCP